MAGSSGGGGGGGVPPGFRFHPTDEELLHFYLKKKVSFQKFDMEVIREVDLNKIEPWDLQEKCKIGSSAQNEWYFFSHKDRKYPTGSRTNRATSAGFWKATGRDKCIRNSFNKIGMRKTLVFYRGRAPHGQKTDWIMHEYRLEDSDHPHDHPHSTTQEDGWVICRVFKKKTLIKIGSSTSSEGRGGGGGMMTNSSDHQLNNMSSTTSASNSCNPAAARSIFRNQYLVHPHHNTDLNVYNIPAPHDHHHFPQLEAQDFISTHHPHISTNVYHHHNLSTTDYDDHRHQPQSVMTTNMQVKQFMTNSNVNVRDHDCESATPAAAAAYNSNIECEDHSSQPNLDQWDNRGLHVITNPTTTTSSSINQINHPSEMDFWAYGK